jgi:hypothetical protein
LAVLLFSFDLLAVLNFIDWILGLLFEAFGKLSAAKVPIVGTIVTGVFAGSLLISLFE